MENSEEYEKKLNDQRITGRRFQRTEWTGEIQSAFPVNASVRELIKITFTAR